jgi:hypothetical protein
MAMTVLAGMICTHEMNENITRMQHAQIDKKYNALLKILISTQIYIAEI